MVTHDSMEGDEIGHVDQTVGILVHHAEDLRGGGRSRRSQSFGSHFNSISVLLSIHSKRANSVLILQRPQAACGERRFRKEKLPLPMLNAFSVEKPCTLVISLDERIHA